MHDIFSIYVPRSFVSYTAKPPFFFVVVPDMKTESAVIIVTLANSTGSPVSPSFITPLTDVPCACASMNVHAASSMAAANILIVCMSFPVF